MIYQVSKKSPNAKGEVFFDVILLDKQRVLEKDVTYIEAQEFCVSRMKPDDVFQFDLYGDITYTYCQSELKQTLERSRRERQQV